MFATQEDLKNDTDSTINLHYSIFKNNLGDRHFTNPSKVNANNNSLLQYVTGVTSAKPLKNDDFVTINSARLKSDYREIQDDQSPVDDYPNTDLEGRPINTPRTIGALQNGSTVYNISNDVILLHKTLEKALSGDIINIAAGTYKPKQYQEKGPEYLASATFKITKNIQLIGDASGTGTTTLDGDKISYHVVHIEAGNIYDPIGSMCQLKNLTITNGIAKGATLDQQKGAGIYLNGQGTSNECSPTIVNCTFENNQAKYGAALFADGKYDGKSTPKITGCTFKTDNVAMVFGNGIYASGFEGDITMNVQGTTFEDTQTIVIDNGKSNGISVFDDCTFKNRDGATITVLRYQSGQKVQIKNPPEDDTTNYQNGFCNPNEAIEEEAIS